MNRNKKTKSPNFCCGDVAYSKKYSCKVTVRKQIGDKVTCDWFDKSNRHHREQFNADTLQPLPNV